jgi:SlyX protein
MEQLTANTQARIDELETRLALQDQSIQQLSDELYRQQQQIAQLELTVRGVVERLAEVARPEPAAGPRGEIPPHY